MRKVVYIIIDGMADLPIDGETPLSTAYKPNMDWLAKNGVVGEVNLVPKTMNVWSHIADVSLLGYDPKKIYLKRGPIEAIGADIPLKEGHLAIRCNFATIDDNNEKIIDRRAGRSDYGLDELSRYINENVSIGVPFSFLRTYGHRAVLTIKANLSDEITDNDPYRNGEKVKRVTGLTKDAMLSAKIVQDFIDKVHDVIKFHPKNGERKEKGFLPANYIIVREAGNKVKAYPRFLKTWKIKKATCIAELGVTRGICLLAGMGAVTVPDVSFEESLNFIFDNINDLLPDNQLIVVHIKGPDLPAHDGNFKEKKKMIEKIDEKLEQFKNFNGILVITSDHITSTYYRKHEHGPVPVLIYGKGKDAVKTFDEISVKKGKLKKYDGKKLLKYIFSSR